DIILEKNSGKLKRINELHPCYLPLQYPLIFPYGEDGFRLGPSTITPFTSTVSGGCLYYDREPSSSKVTVSSFTGGPRTHFECGRSAE
uniref:Uncharacterized protein n=1 Tax=Brassica oleracea var. oleracea TaxID=109376 RepID=A0A0D3AV48_BRAOL